MKILIATDTYLPSVNGTVSFVHRLAMGLVRKNHQVFIIAPSSSIKNTKYTDSEGIVIFGIRSVPIKAYPNLRIAPPYIAKRSIKKIVQKIKPDIVHIQDHFTLGREVFQAAHSLNIPVIGTNHFLPENFIHYVPLVKLAKRPVVKLTWTQFLMTYNHLDIITTPTKTSAKLMLEAGIEKKVIPVSNGIDLKIFNPKNNGDYLKSRYHLPKKKIMLFIGRLDKEKRIDIILKALPLIRKKVDVHLCLGGVGAEATKLEELIQKLKISDHVSMLGFIPDQDLANLYKVADLFVVACIAELQSIATMEAMASGLPIVAVNAKALPELVKDGENGYLFETDNFHQLAHQATKILSDDKLQQKMSKTSIKIIRSHSIEKTVSQFEKLYQRAILKHPKKSHQSKLPLLNLPKHRLMTRFAKALTS